MWVSVFKTLVSHVIHITTEVGYKAKPGGKEDFKLCKYNI